MQIELAGWGSVEPGDDDSVEDQFKKKTGTYRKNYGSRILGPWVFAMYKSTSEMRFSIVPDRKGTKLRRLIAMNVEKGSYITTDEWRAYKRLSEDGLIDRTVNHSY